MWSEFMIMESIMSHYLLLTINFQVYIDLQADPFPEDPHVQERLNPHHPQLRCWHPSSHSPLLSEQGHPFNVETNLAMVDLQVVQVDCVEGDVSRCSWEKEERSDIMGSLLFRAYLVTSEILLR